MGVTRESRLILPRSQSMRKPANGGKTGNNSAGRVKWIVRNTGCRSPSTFGQRQQHRSDVQPALAHPFDHCRIPMREEGAGSSFEPCDSRHVRFRQVELPRFRGQVSVLVL